MSVLYDNNNNNNVPFLYSAYHIQMASLCARGIITPALDDVQMDKIINSQENKSFDIYAVTIKIYMTEYQYHHWINGQA